MKTKHTPTPWQVVILDGEVYIQHGDGTKENSGFAVGIKCHKKEDADFIVKAVNNFENLKTACVYALNEVRNGND